MSQSPPSSTQRVGAVASARPEAAARSSAWLSVLCLGALLVAAAAALAWLGGNYSREFGTGVESYDEPAHYVTGLLIRDYLAEGIPANPLRFAGNYYLHYPKVALGVWPPFFHLTEAIWMLVFTPSRASVLLLMTIISVVSAVTLFLMARKPFGPVLAGFAALIYVAVPVVQNSSSSVFVDGLVAALELLAIVQLARYIDTVRPAYLYRFGLLATLAVLSKANGLALILAPAIALGLSGKLRLLRRKEVWLALAMVLLAAAPWNLFLARVAMGSIGLLRADWSSFAERAASSLRGATIETGVFLPLAAIGVWQRVVRPLRSGNAGAIWAANLALIAAVYLFHVIVPSDGDIPQRYLLPLLAPTLLFAVAGMEAVASIIPFRRWKLDQRTGAVAAICAAAFFLFQFRVTKTEPAGFRPTAELLAHGSGPQVILVCGDARKEGMAVSEIAMRDSRPRHYVLRASKVLAQSDWTGQGYQALFRSPQEIATYLDSVPVDYVLLDAMAHHPAPHHQLLADTLRSHSGIWERDTSAGGALQLWRRVHPLPHGEPKITIGMSYTLRHPLSNENASTERRR